MSEVIAYLWQAPQNLLGLLITVAVPSRTQRRERYRTAAVNFALRRYGGVSLGRYVFVHVDADAALIRHELGHVVQSRRLGPAYLLVVGLPSFAWAVAFPIIARVRPGVSYHRFYTERWADRLGRHAL